MKSTPRKIQAYALGFDITGYDISADDQLTYNQWLANQVLYPRYAIDKRCIWSSWSRKAGVGTISYRLLLVLLEIAKRVSMTKWFALPVMMHQTEAKLPI